MDVRVRAELLEILRNGRGRWWLSLSLWPRLSNSARAYLEKRWGTAKGKRGGHRHGPITRISQRLAAEARSGTSIERDYLDTRGLWVREYEASGSQSAIFRWIGP
jgi:hypothetical protein